MFIWGDEVEYYKRILAAGFEVGTVWSATHRHPKDRVPTAWVVRPSLAVYAGALDWKAFCFFRNLGLIAKSHGRGKGVSVLFRYFYFYLICRHLDFKALRFFGAYRAGWREDFSRRVPF